MSTYTSTAFDFPTAFGASRETRGASLMERILARSDALQLVFGRPLRESQNRPTPKAESPMSAATGKSDELSTVRIAERDNASSTTDDASPDMTASEQEAADLAAAVERVRGGDKNSFRLLVDRCQRRLVYVIGRYVRSPDDAEEIAQRAFMKAYRSLDKLDNPLAFRSWLYRIGINLALNHVRDEGKRATTPIDDIREPAAEAMAERSAIAKEQLHTLQAGLDSLTPMQRDVLLLRLDGGIPYAEIAERIGSTEGSVRVHYHNAVRKLRALLEDADGVSNAS